MGRRSDAPLALVLLAFAGMALFSYGFTAYDFGLSLFADGVAYSLVDRDFANYWMGGRLALSGDYLDLFSQGTYFPHLQQMFGADYQIRNWSYPPHYLLLMSPLGYLGYEAAFVAFMAVTFGLFVAGAVAFKREFAPHAGQRVLWLVVPSYVLMMVATTQNGFLTSALLLLGLAWMRSRPFLAGLAFAFLTVKPQLGLLVPVLLLFDRNWKAIASVIAMTLVLVALSTAAYGVQSWVAYLTETLAYQRAVMSDWHGLFLRMMPTVFGSMRTLGFTPATAVEAQTPFSAVAFLAVLLLLYIEREPLRRAFVVLCGTFLVSPYAYNYDMGALCVCAALLADGELVKRRSLAAWAMALIAASPAAVMNLGRAGVPVVPLVLAVGMATLLTVAIRAARSSTREAAAAG